MVKENREKPVAAPTPGVEKRGKGRTAVQATELDLSWPSGFSFHAHLTPKFTFFALCSRE